MCDWCTAACHLRHASTNVISSFTKPQLKANQILRLFFYKISSTPRVDLFFSSELAWLAPGLGRVGFWLGLELGLASAWVCLFVCLLLFTFVCLFVCLFVFVCRCCCHCYICLLLHLFVVCFCIYLLLLLLALTPHIHSSH